MKTEMENGITFEINKRTKERDRKLKIKEHGNINALANTVKRWVWKDTNHSIGGDNNNTTIYITEENKNYRTNKKL